MRFKNSQWVCVGFGVQATNQHEYTVWARPHVEGFVAYKLTYTSNAPGAGAGGYYTGYDALLRKNPQIAFTVDQALANELTQDTLAANAVDTRTL